MKLQTPTALATVHLAKTATGYIKRVRLIIAGHHLPVWRTYHPDYCHDEAIRKALVSADIAHAWYQLPLDSGIGPVYTAGSIQKSDSS